MSATTQLKRAVARLIRAEVANSWRGGGYSEDIPAIEKELKSARTNYNTKLDTLAAIEKAYDNFQDYKDRI